MLFPLLHIQSTLAVWASRYYNAIDTSYARKEYVIILLITDTFHRTKKMNSKGTVHDNSVGYYFCSQAVLIFTYLYIMKCTILVDVEYFIIPWELQPPMTVTWVSSVAIGVHLPDSLQVHSHYPMSIEYISCFSYASFVFFIIFTHKISASKAGKTFPA